MLTILIETRDSEQALAETLVPLVGAMVGGLLKQVIIWDHGSTDGTAIVAEAAGCDLLHDLALADVLHQVKSRWVLILQPGSRPDFGWEAVVQDHMEKAQSAACFRPATNDAGFLARIFGRRATAGAGLLVPLAMLSKLATLEKAAEQLKPVRLNHGIMLARDAA